MRQFRTYRGQMRDKVPALDPRAWVELICMTLREKWNEFNETPV